MAQYVFLARELFGSPRNGAQRVLPKIHPRSGTPWTSCARSCEHVLLSRRRPGRLARDWNGAGTGPGQSFEPTGRWVAVEVARGDLGHGPGHGPCLLKSSGSAISPLRNGACQTTSFTNVHARLLQLGRLSQS